MWKEKSPVIAEQHLNESQRFHDKYKFCNLIHFRKLISLKDVCSCNIENTSSLNKDFGFKRETFLLTWWQYPHICNTGRVSGCINRLFCSDWQQTHVTSRFVVVPVISALASDRPTIQTTLILLIWIDYNLTMKLHATLMSVDVCVAVIRFSDSRLECQLLKK